MILLLSNFKRFISISILYLTKLIAKSSKNALNDAWFYLSFLKLLSALINNAKNIILTHGF